MKKLRKPDSERAEKIKKARVMGTTGASEPGSKISGASESSRLWLHSLLNFRRSIPGIFTLF